MCETKVCAKCLVSHLFPYLFCAILRYTTFSSGKWLSLSKTTCIVFFAEVCFLHVFQINYMHIHFLDRTASTPHTSRNTISRKRIWLRTNIRTKQGTVGWRFAGAPCGHRKWPPKQSEKPGGEGDVCLLPGGKEKCLLLKWKNAMDILERTHFVWTPFRDHQTGIKTYAASVADIKPSFQTLQWTKDDKIADKSKKTQKKCNLDKVKSDPARATIVAVLLQWLKPVLSRNQFKCLSNTKPFIPTTHNMQRHAMPCNAMQCP